MRPPIPVMLPKIVPPEGDTLNGVFIPGGTAVGWNLHSLMGAPRHFGPDADRFRPERFLEADKETRTARERLVEMVFGYGRFACAGKPLAMMELSKVFFEVSSLPSRPDSFFSPSLLEHWRAQRRSHAMLAYNILTCCGPSPPPLVAIPTL